MANYRKNINNRGQEENKQWQMTGMPRMIEERRELNGR
jgi:hypothetical protein